MTAITAGRVERSTSPLQTNVIRRDRRLTDKYCIFLFLILYVIWVLTAQHVVHRKPECEIKTRFKPKNCTSDIFNNKTDSNVTSENKSLANKTVEYVSQIWGKNLLFDVLTFNIGFSDTNYQRSDSIVILAHVLIAIGLITYFLKSMRTDYYYCRQIHLIFILLACVTLARVIYFQSKSPSTKELFFIFYGVPELLMFLIMCAKGKSRRSNKSKDKDYNAVECIREYQFNSIVFIYLHCPILLIFWVIIDSKYNFNWEYQYSYMYAGVIGYMCLVHYYFWLIVLSFATGRSIDHEDKYCSLINMLRGIFTVFRYHFGSACYHATLILPRIHSMFIMNEKEFKENRKLSIFQRFYLTYWKIPNVSLSLTGARGYNYAESTRESLRLFISESPKLKNFQINAQIFRSFSAFLIGTNILLIISYWAHGVILDPEFTTGTWITYLSGSFFAFLGASIFDTVSDTVWFDYHENLANNV